MGTLYRTNMDISVGETIIPAGVTTRLAGVSERGKDHLIERTAIQVVSEPPFAALPDWRDRVERLARAGIHKPTDLLDADIPEAVKVIRVRPHILRQWQEEAARLILPDGATIYGG